MDLAKKNTNVTWARSQCKSLGVRSDVGVRATGRHGGSGQQSLENKRNKVESWILVAPPPRSGRGYDWLL